MKNFSLIGAAGYIAPRHLQAIEDTGNKLVSAYDPMDSVGILDRYTKNVEYFKTFEQFDYYNRNEFPEDIDYVSICSPNYMHKSHIAYALQIGADAICEKPIVLTTSDIAELKNIESQTGKRIYTILQLRMHEKIKQLREKVLSDSRREKFDIDLTYITSRGPWYFQTWKAESKLSGGLPTNIGVHFFDMLTWIFGKIERNELHICQEKTCGGYLELERAKIKWVLSIDQNSLPEYHIKNNLPTYRSITIDGKEIEFSGGFSDLHTAVYQNILAGQGYGLSDTFEAIKVVEELRELPPTGLKAYSHEFFKKI